MRSHFEQRRCVLAINPTSKGFGFAILEGPTRLIDWGVKRAINVPDRNGRALQIAGELIRRYQPDLLAVEETNASGARRCPRVRKLIECLLALARDRRLAVRAVPRGRVYRHFSNSGLATKRDIAVALADRFPELEPDLPPVRKAWMSEDERMSIFGAVALAVTCYRSPHRSSPSVASPPVSPTVVDIRPNHEHANSCN